MDVAYLFAGIGLIILIGFMGTQLFERTKIPDILILIFMGLVIGPLLTQYTNFGLLDDPEMGSSLATIAPHFAAFALIIILFDGGLNLHLEKTIRKMNLAVAHTAMAFVGSVLVTAVMCHYFFGMDIRVSVLLGSIIGGVGSAVAIPLLQKSSVKEETKILLTLEAVLTDVLCIVTALIMIEILEGSALDAGGLLERLLSSFVLAGFIGFIFGVFWLMILRELEGKPFAFMITIAALMLLYAVAEFIQVSGAIAALTFGLVLGNKEEIARMLRLKGRFVLDEHIREFHTEVSFLIRTFFFVYLGITFTFTLNSDMFGTLPWYIPAWLVEQPILLLAVFLALLFLGFFLVRYATTSLTCHVQKESAPDKSYINIMLSKDLATAVLAQLPFTIAAYTVVGAETPYHALLHPYRDLFLNIVFMSIVVSVIITSICASVIERRRASYRATQVESDDWTSKSPMYRKAVRQEDMGRQTEPARARTIGKEGPKPWKVQEPQGAAPPRKLAQPQPTKPRPAEANARTTQKLQQPQAAKTVQPTAVPRPSRPHSQHPLARRAAEAEKVSEKSTVQPKKPKK